jgi:hypothetical protein
MPEPITRRDVLAGLKLIKAKLSLNLKMNPHGFSKAETEHLVMCVEAATKIVEQSEAAHA